MPLYYLTGVSGTGKSTVLRALAAQGWVTYDEDTDGLSAWYEKSSGRKAERAERTQNWYSQHDWRISRLRLEELAAQHRSEKAFVCGSTLSDEAVWDLFAGAICLTIDEATLRARLLARKGNDWGKEPAEMEHVLSWREPWEKRYRELGALMIDGTMTVPEVARLVLEGAK